MTKKSEYPKLPIGNIFRKSIPAIYHPGNPVNSEHILNYGNNPRVAGNRNMGELITKWESNRYSCEF
jgi:hypothetical protein